MVKYRSEHSRSRAGIHGGVRRGSAAAAIGAVLVLTAGVPASQADGASGSEEPDVQVTGGVQLPGVGGLLEGLLGDASTAPASPQPVPETTTIAPSPVPATTVPTTPAPAAPQPPTGAAATGTAAPLAATSPLDPGAAAAPLQPEAAAAPEVSAGTAADIPAAQQPSAGDGVAPSAAALMIAGATSTSRTGAPQAVGAPAQSRQQMTAQAEPAAETAKVWLGVGLVGSAGAAGLVFTRIRRF